MLMPVTVLAVNQPRIPQINTDQLEEIREDRRNPWLLFLNFAFFAVKSFFAQKEPRIPQINTDLLKGIRGDSRNPWLFFARFDAVFSPAYPTNMRMSPVPRPLACCSRMPVYG